MLTSCSQVLPKRDSSHLVGNIYLASNEAQRACAFPCTTLAPASAPLWTRIPVCPDAHVYKFRSVVPVDPSIMEKCKDLQWQGSSGSCKKFIWISKCGCSYTHSGIQFTATSPPEWFLSFEKAVFDYLNFKDHFNCCNITFYQNGSEGLGWHADDEPLFGSSAVSKPILSLSIGASRLFGIKVNNTNQTVKLTLSHGEALLMDGLTQTLCKHKLFSDQNCTLPRVNFTWRKVINHNCS